MHMHSAQEPVESKNRGDKREFKSRRALIKKRESRLKATTTTFQRVHAPAHALIYKWDAKYVHCISFCFICKYSNEKEK